MEDTLEDLFEREQKILDHATAHQEEVLSGIPYNFEEYSALVREYARLLKQLRRVTRITDKITVDLNLSKLDLLDKMHLDALTGIYNRGFLEDRMNGIIKTMSRSRAMLSVMMLDVDYFKRYNDTYGHSSGDDCLKTIARALNESITREADFVARYGGEEFVIVLPNTDERGARVMAEKILENVRACKIPHEKNEAADFITISIGVTTGNVEYMQCGGDYIKRADEALYMSKHNGRDRYTYINFTEES